MRTLMQCITYRVRHRRLTSSDAMVHSLILRDVCYKERICSHYPHLQCERNQLQMATSRLLSSTSQSKTSAQGKTDGASINNNSHAKDRVHNTFDFRKTNSSSSNVEPFRTYSALYNFKGLMLTRRILRLQYAITPFSWYLVWSSSFETFVIAFSALSTTVSILFLSFMPRVVMRFSVGKTGDMIDTAKVSTLNVLGRRKDMYYKISDIVPLMELPAITSKDWYIPFLVYGEKKRRFLFLLGAQWDDHATFKKIMGDFPHGKK
ncbi:hypothetical protein FSP39_016485 [Pinctada imbricata]|uniref:Transmembrane protein 186 n=1 Tax=Pinctada imbricata TaxID=66713 RepID=A0AA89BPY6_PINIB|nr:hypothetical protein FSP39_016485 [Pinctada imbricata]